jgi:glycoprotein-N-acetylgalactosamine 3-beta-galactosyltransferase
VAPLWWMVTMTMTTTVDQSPAAADPSKSTVHDPLILRKHPLPLSSNVTGVCDVPPGQGEEGPAGLRGLYKIKTKLKTKTALQTIEKVPPIRLLCMVYTHSNRHNVLRSIVETYAPQCDGFLAASNLTDPSLGAYNVSHFGPEAYGNMWNKVQAVWFYVHQNHLMDFDWFHIGGDDMYVIPDNIRKLAAQHPPKRAWYLGGSIPNAKNPKRRYCGGGAGYTLNRRAVHLLVRRFASGDCPAALASDEDVRVGRCLEDAGVPCQDTNDDATEVRYHHLDAQFHAAWVPTRPALWLWEKLDYFHHIRGNQSKLAQISNTSTSFHLDKGIVRSRALDRGIRRYHAILYDHVCGPDFADQVAQAATMMSDNKEERDKLHRQWQKLPKAVDATV